MDIPAPETQPAGKRDSLRRKDGAFFSLRMTPAVLCYPLGVIGAVGLWFALCLPEICYPAAYRAWPMLGEVFSPTTVPPILTALMVFCGACSVCFVLASLAAAIFQKGWALWVLRKSYILYYVLFIFYGYVVLTVTGQVADAVAEKPDPTSGLEVAIFAWQWQLLWVPGCLLLLVIVLHVVSWRRATLILYGGPDEEEPAVGDKIIENVRTNGPDPTFRKSIYGSAVVHLMVIIIIPFLLSRFGGCIRPYRVPLGSGNPAVAKMIVMKKKKKKKKRKKYILAKNSAIIFTPPELDDSELVKEVEEATNLTYAADTNAAHGAMGTGGGNTPGWADGFADGEVRFIRLEYNGKHWDDGMGKTLADVNFLNKFREFAGGIKTARQSESHPVSHLRKYPKGQAPPFVYMTGSEGINMSQADVKILREYLQGGGMLFADCGSPHWDRSFQGFVRAIFPGNPLIEISEDDPIFQIPFTFPHGAPPLWHHGGNKAKGVKYKGRWCVFYFPGDLNDAWKTGHSGIDPELAKNAFHLGTNIVYYSFTKYLQETRKYRK